MIVFGYNIKVSLLFISVWFCFVCFIVLDLSMFTSLTLHIFVNVFCGDELIELMLKTNE